MCLFVGLACCCAQSGWAPIFCLCLLLSLCAVCLQGFFTTWCLQSPHCSLGPISRAPGPSVSSRGIWTQTPKLGPHSWPLAPRSTTAHRQSYMLPPHPPLPSLHHLPSWTRHPPPRPNLPPHVPSATSPQGHSCPSPPPPRLWPPHLLPPPHPLPPGPSLCTIPRTSHLRTLPAAQVQVGLWCPGGLWVCRRPTRPHRSPAIVPDRTRPV